jgi:hypothetical protein
MSSSIALRRMLQIGLAGAIFVSVGSVRAGESANLNPKAITWQLPNEIKWVESPAGSAQAVMYGDPSKPGLYITLTKWHAHHMSRPHFHPNDRFITVISGTWWVGTGTKYDPDKTVALPAGSFARHYGKEVHWDGAKDEDVVLEILGEGPATSTPAEVK